MQILDIVVSRSSRLSTALEKKLYILKKKVLESNLIDLDFLCMCAALNQPSKPDTKYMEPDAKGIYSKCFSKVKNFRVGTAEHKTQPGTFLGGGWYQSQVLSQSCQSLWPGDDVLSLWSYAASLA